MSEHKTDELHSAIMNLPCKVPTIEASNGKHDLIWASGYKLGHRDARHAAAELVCAAIPQAVSAEPQWLPVSGRMPEKDVEVLVYDSSADHVYVTQWCDWWEAPVSFSSKTICVGEGWETGEYEHVTHWMPLPPAPKEQP